MRRRRWLAVALVATTAELFPPGAPAQVQTLFSNGHATMPKVGAPAAGGFRVSWWDFGETQEVMGRWQATSAVGSGVFSDASPIVPHGTWGNYVEALDGQVAAWLDRPRGRVYFVLRRPDGTARAPRPLSAARRSATAPTLAADSAGNAVVCWQLRAGRFWRAQCAIRRAGSESFGAAATLAKGLGRKGFSPRPFLGRRGRLLVLYENRRDAPAALGSVTHGFKPGVPFGRHDPDFLHARAAVAPNGGATVVVTEEQRTGRTGTIRVRALRFFADGRAPVSQLLRRERGVGPLTDLGASTLAAFSDGSALAAWTVGHRLLAARARAGRVFGQAVQVASFRSRFSPFAELAAGPGGTAALIWVDETGDAAKSGLPSKVVHLARYARGAWQRPLPVSARDEIAVWPSVAASADSTVAVAWVEGDGSLTGNIKAAVVGS